MAFTNDTLAAFTRALAIDRGHLGLIITSGDPGLLTLPAPADAAEIIALTVDTDPESVLDRLVACASEGRWCRIHLLDGALPGRVYNQLRTIATTGHATARDGTDVRWPDAVGIVVMIAQGAEQHITVPTFLDLFGPVLRGV